MGMHTYNKVKNMLCEELERVANKGELTAGSLDIVDKLTHSIKSIETIMAMNEYEDDYSERGNSYARRGRTSYRQADNNSYEDGVSMARRRGYSREDNKDALISKLESMAINTTDERMKSTINRCINELERD